MSRVLGGLAALLCLAASPALAGELDAEYGSRAPGKAPGPVAAAAVANSDNALPAAGNELDAEAPAQAWRRFGGFYRGWGGFGGFRGLGGFGGWGFGRPFYGGGWGLGLGWGGYRGFGFGLGGFGYGGGWGYGWPGGYGYGYGGWAPMSYGFGFPLSYGYSGWCW